MLTAVSRFSLLLVAFLASFPYVDYLPIMRLLLLIILLPITVYAQDFTWEIDSIPYEQNGWQPFQPWLGGGGGITAEFCDIDNDGDFDLFTGRVAGDAYVAYFKNIGTASEPNFELETLFFDSLFILGGQLETIFCDIDNDDDYDLFLLSNYESKLYLNQGNPYNPQYILYQDNFLSSYYPVGADFVDIDADNDYDIIIADYTGMVYLCCNTGSPEVFQYSDTLEIIISLPSVYCFV